MMTQGRWTNERGRIKSHQLRGVGSMRLMLRRLPKERPLPRAESCGVDAGTEFRMYHDSDKRKNPRINCTPLT
jgi:hypothetical protein